jgi:type VI secretion system protein ImpA
VGGGSSAGPPWALEALQEPRRPRVGGASGADVELGLAAIRSARTWFEAHEPSSPVALLLKQAERLTGKRFDEVFQAIPADLVERWAQAD